MVSDDTDDDSTVISNSFPEPAACIVFACHCLPEGVIGEWEVATRLEKCLQKNC